MKVLVVCDVLGAENNGTTIAAMNLIRYLRSKGDEVRILCADQDKKGMENVFVVPNLHLGFIIDHIVKKNNVTLSRPSKKIILQALDGVDIVHVMIPFPLGIAATKEARKKGIPVTAGFHCQAENFSAHIQMMNCSLVNRLVYKNYYKKLYSKVNAVHYPTQFIRDIFENTVKRKTNGYVISNGVNSIYKKKEIIERKPEYTGKFNILFIGRISKEKSHHLLIKAVSLSKHKDDIQLIFAGQGPREQEVMNFAKKCKINTPYMKFFTRTDLVDTINSCDLYVHPAEIEIEAISCLEAISCGLVPVINNSPRSATKAFALDDKNLFDFNDPKDLADKIDYWIEHPLEKAKRSEEYLGYSDKFEQTKCMEDMRKMLLTYSKEENRTPKRTYYYRDEINDDFANNGIQSKGTPENYKYVHKCPIFLGIQFVLYNLIARPLVRFINKVAYRQKIIDKTTIHPNKLRGGFFIYANHTLDMGDAFTPNLISHKRNSIICGPEAISIPGIKTLVTMFGAYPLPKTMKGTDKYLKGIEHKIRRGESITIYPEAHIWPYYTKIRNYKDASFRYPVNLNCPSYCLTNTYERKKRGYRLVTYIDGPFFPDTSLSAPEAKRKLRNQIYETMLKRSNSKEQYQRNNYIDISTIEEK